MLHANGGFTKLVSRSATLSAIVIAVTLTGCAAPSNEQPEKKAETANVKMIPRWAESTERAIAEGNFNDAQRLLMQMMLVDAKNPQALLLAAELHLATGLLDQSLTEFEAIKDVPEITPRARQGMGLALLLKHKDEAAFSALNDAVVADSRLWRAWNALGYYYDSKKKWSDAENCYNKAISAEPRSSITYNNRGFSYFLQGKFDDAVRDLTKAAELDPKLKEARRNLRLAVASSGNYTGAVLGASGDGLTEALNNVGYVALLRGEYSTAESYFLRAMEADAGFNSVAWRNLSYLKSVKGANSKATD